MVNNENLEDSFEEEQEPFHPHYPQPYNIRHINTGNAALDHHLILKEHGRLKYQAKYQASKQSKRMKSAD